MWVRNGSAQRPRRASKDESLIIKIMNLEGSSDLSSMMKCTCANVEKYEIVKKYNYKPLRIWKYAIYRHLLLKYEYVVNFSQPRNIEPVKDWHIGLQ